MRHMPRIVALLNGQSEPKNTIRSVFTSVVTPLPGSGSNVPRVLPAELMVLLHKSEKEIGLKSAIEGKSFKFLAICLFFEHFPLQRLICASQ